jgi:uncharacterized protein (DUF2267 family)
MSIAIGTYVEETNQFLRQLATELGDPSDIDHAGRVVIAVFHTLRERISVEESMHLVSQLPMILKGVYVHGWDLSRRMIQADTLDEFLNEIRDHANRTQERDFGEREQTRDNVKAVLRVIQNYVSEGEISHIKAQLPREIAALFE